MSPHWEHANVQGALNRGKPDRNRTAVRTKRVIGTNLTTTSNPTGLHNRWSRAYARLRVAPIGVHRPSERGASTMSDTTETNPSGITMRNGHPVIDPLHPNVLGMYRGTLIEATEYVRTLVEFPTLHHATAWANGTDILGRVSLYSGDATFDKPVIVRLHPAPIAGAR